jgi:hypothetical protein
LLFPFTDKDTLASRTIGAALTAGIGRLPFGNRIQFTDYCRGGHKCGPGVIELMGQVENINAVLILLAFDQKLSRGVQATAHKFIKMNNLIDFNFDETNFHSNGINFHFGWQRTTYRLWVHS